MERKMTTVTIIKSPITERYVNPGQEGRVDYNCDPPMIQTGGVWFNFHKERWKVVEEKDKKESIIKELIDAADGVDYLSDRKFTDIVDSYNLNEEQVIEWMVESNKFNRFVDGFGIKSN